VTPAAFSWTLVHTSFDMRDKQKARNVTPLRAKVVEVWL
jgi:hypothetical protein